MKIIGTLLLTLTLLAPPAFGTIYTTGQLSQKCIDLLKLSEKDHISRIDLIKAMLFSGLSPEDVAIKKEKLSTAFVFMRATADLYYFDLSNLLWLRDLVLKYSQLRDGTPLVSMISADNHIANIDLANVSDVDPLATPRMVMTRNDFDEVIMGHWSADVLRLASSIVHFGREGGWSDEEIHPYVVQAVKSFVDTVKHIEISRLAGRPESEIDDELELNKDRLEGIALKHLQKIENKKTPESALNKWAEQVNGRWQFKEQEGRFRKLAPDHPVAQNVLAAMKNQSSHIAQRMGLPNSFFNVLSFGQRLGAGAGSMGVERYYALVQGFPGKPPVILDLKEQPVPAALLFLPDDLQFVSDMYSERYGDNHALRVMRGSGFMSLDANPIWGWLSVGIGNGLVNYLTVSQVSPFKAGFPIEKLYRPENQDKLEKIKAELGLMAKYWGQVTALGQYRSDDDFKRDLTSKGLLSSYKISERPLTLLITETLFNREDEFAREITEAGFVYADKNEEDFENLLGSD